ncbi:hypothetical protein [Maricaulis sp.]|uniref:hypothetical protein n=1 Tax=Maricaulis sp. TaxID=1486257 RepID=UPI0025C64104|nr:hypothetical protein [Maricaulis sp.]
MSEPVTVLIPLYRSGRFLPILSETIRTHLETGIPVTVSDRNGDAALIGTLRDQFAGASGFSSFVCDDDDHWVANMNSLIAATQTPYFRILPHDDSASPESTLRMCRALEADPDAVLAFGPVRAWSLDGVRMPDRDQSNADMADGHRHWRRDTALALFWSGRCAGAFKGVVRRIPKGLDSPLMIRPTPSLAHSERIWLSALGLLGHFRLEPDAVLHKRYYDESTHRRWKFNAAEYADAASVLLDYVAALIEPGEDRQRAERAIRNTAVAYDAWFRDGDRGPVPGFNPLRP